MTRSCIDLILLQNLIKAVILRNFYSFNFPNTKIYLPLIPLSYEKENIFIALVLLCLTFIMCIMELDLFDTINFANHDVNFMEIFVIEKCIMSVLILCCNFNGKQYDAWGLWYIIMWCLKCVFLIGGKIIRIRQVHECKLWMKSIVKDFKNLEVWWSRI